MSKIATEGDCYNIRNTPDRWWLNTHCPSKKEIIDTEYFTLKGSYADNQLVQLSDVRANPSFTLFNDTSSNAKVGSADVAQSTISAMSSVSLSNWKNKTLEWHILSTPSIAKKGEVIAFLNNHGLSIQLSDIDNQLNGNFDISFSAKGSIELTLKNNSFVTSNKMPIGIMIIRLSNRFAFSDCKLQLFMG